MNRQTRKTVRALSQLARIANRESKRRSRARRANTITRPATRSRQTITRPEATPPPATARRPRRSKHTRVKWVMLFMIFIAIVLGLWRMWKLTPPLSTIQSSYSSSTRKPAAVRQSIPTRKPSTPTPGPTAVQSVPKTSFAVTQYSNVRSGPGTNYPPFTQIPEGTKISPNGRNADGSWIRFPIDNSNGWIYAPLTTISNTSTLPVVDAPPPPPKSTPAPTQPKITTPSTPTNPPPQPAQSGTFLSGSYHDLNAQGKVPKGGWTPDNVNYLPKRDRDIDGRTCEN